MTDDYAVLAILGLTLGIYVGVMWVNVVINARGDDIRSGVINGLPLSTADRRLLLYGNWLPYTAFTVGLLVFATVGVLVFARASGAPQVRAIGYISAVFFGNGAVFMTVIGIAHFVSLSRAIQPTGK